MTWKLQGPSRIINYDECLNVVRNGKVDYKDGKPVFPQPILFEITCNAQPMTGRDLLLVPEGDRYKEQWWVWMNQKAKPLLINDRVERKGLDQNNAPILVNYQVQEVQNWGSYTRARIMRIDVGPNKTP